MHRVIIVTRGSIRSLPKSCVTSTSRFVMLLLHRMGVRTTLTALKNSSLWTDRERYFSGQEYLLADSAYELSIRITTPYRCLALGNDRQRKNFNVQLSKGMSCCWTYYKHLERKVEPSAPQLDHFGSRQPWGRCKMDICICRILQIPLDMKRVFQCLTSGLVYDCCARRLGSWIRSQKNGYWAGLHHQRNRGSSITISRDLNWLSMHPITYRYFCRLCPVLRQADRIGLMFVKPQLESLPIQCF